MKVVRFLFACVWIPILLGVVNILIVACGYEIKESAIGGINLLALVAMAVAWLVFPFTIAPILHLTESPFKRFSMRCASATAVGFLCVGVLGNAMGALNETRSSPPDPSSEVDPFAQ